MAREPRAPPSTGRAPHIREPHSGELGVSEFTQAGRYHPLTRLVRPYVDVLAPPNEPREPQVPDLVRPEAFIEWGDPGNFEANPFREEAMQVGFRLKEDDDDKPKRERFTFSEEGRRTADYKIIGEDGESYVIERMATEVAFSGPDSAQFKLIFKNAPPPNSSRVGQGQTPPAPPDLEDIEVGGA